MRRRFVYNDNGSFTDYTNVLNDYFSGEMSFSYIVSQDTLFIGSVLPFNHFYVKLGTQKNDQTANIRICLWDGNSWEDAAEILDSTSSASKTLAKDGYIRFVPNKHKTWLRDDTVNSSDQEIITGMGTSIIYDQYWAALTFNASLTSDVKIKWIGNIFSDDDMLGSEYPDLVRSTVMTAVDSTKSSWEEQHKTAADIIIKDLIARKIIISGDQILEKEDLELASVSKVAEIIYGQLGDDYEDNRVNASKNYATRMNNAFAKVDKNLNAIVDDNEISVDFNRLYR